MVLVNRRVDDLELPSVTADDAVGIELAVAHLAGLGHRRIAHLAGPQNTSTGVVRARAFRHAVRDQGLADDPALVAESAYWSEADGAQALRAAARLGRRVHRGSSAATTCSRSAATTCSTSAGMRCPEDISVVGFNGMPFLDKMQPPLTTVSIPHHELGFEAARLLLDAIEEPDRMPRSVLLAPSLVVRRSTSPPRPAEAP